MSEMSVCLRPSKRELRQNETLLSKFLQTDFKILWIILLLRHDVLVGTTLST